MQRDQSSFRPRCLTADIVQVFKRVKEILDLEFSIIHAVTHTHTRARTDTLIKMLISPVTVPWNKGKGSPYSSAERRVPEPIPIFDSQPAGDMSHKPGGRLPLLSARPAVTLAILKRAAAIFGAW